MEDRAMSDVERVSAQFAREGLPHVMVNRTEVGPCSICMASLQAGAYTVTTARDSAGMARVYGFENPPSDPLRALVERGGNAYRDDAVHDHRAYEMSLLPGKLAAVETALVALRSGMAAAGLDVDEQGEAKAWREP